MARDKGDDGKRRKGRGKDDDGVSDEDLGWLADLRGGPADRPLGDEPRSRRTLRSEEPPTGGVSGPSVTRPVRRTPPLPVPPDGPTSPPPAEPRPPSRGILRRTPATPPPPPPPVSPPPSLAPAGPPPSTRSGGGVRPMADWAEETGELPAAVEPRGRGRTADVRPAGPPPAPTGRLGDSLRTGALRTPPAAAPPAPPMPPAPMPPAPTPAGPMPPAPLPSGPMPAPAGPLPGAPVPGPVPGGLPLPGPLPGGAPDAMTTGMIRRAELRKQLKIQQQLKGVTLVLVVLLLLAAYPVYLFTQTFAADPVFAELDGLDLPEWAAYHHEDKAEGSRWCIQQCRVRERIWDSERGPQDTHPVYATALLADGWRLNDRCVTVSDDSVASCWKKDEYVMIVHVIEPICEVAPPRDPLPGATAAPEETPSARQCPGSRVNMLIMNAIDEGAQF